MYPEKPKIIIVDDHPLIIQGLSTLLRDQGEFDVSGAFTRGGQLTAFLAKQAVDLVILDISMPDISGLELCTYVKERHPQTRVLILSNHTERSIIMQILQNGASGYLLKNAPVDELIRAIHDVLKGALVFSDEIRQIIVSPSHAELRGIVRLTRREKEVLGCLAEGMTTAKIAGELCVSPLTIETHRRNLLEKFQVKNVAELIRTAFEQGFKFPSRK